MSMIVRSFPVSNYGARQIELPADSQLIAVERHPYNSCDVLIIFTTAGILPPTKIFRVNSVMEGAEIPDGSRFLGSVESAPNSGVRYYIFEIGE